MHVQEETATSGRRPRRLARLYAEFLKRKRMWHLWTSILALILMSPGPQLALTCLANLYFLGSCRAIEPRSPAPAATRSEATGPARPSHPKATPAVPAKTPDTPPSTGRGQDREAKPAPKAEAPMTLPEPPPSTPGETEEAAPTHEPELSKHAPAPEDAAGAIGAPEQAHAGETADAAHVEKPWWVEKIIEFIVTLLEKLGEALLIAVVLAFFVDETVKKELLEEAMRDVLPLALTYHLPEKVRNHIKSIMQLPFVREGFTIKYHFEVVHDEERHSYIRVSSSTRYQVRNLTNSEKTYDFRSAIARETDPNLPSSQLRRMDVYRNGRPVRDDSGPDRFPLEGGALTAKIGEFGAYSMVVAHVKVPGDSAEPFQFRTERVEHHFLQDTIVLDILEPACIGITVIVEAPAELGFKINFGHGREPDVHRRGTVQRWVHRDVHLPGSHFRLSWSWTGPRPQEPPMVQAVSAEPTAEPAPSSLAEPPATLVDGTAGLGPVARENGTATEPIASAEATPQPAPREPGPTGPDECAGVPGPGGLTPADPELPIATRDGAIDAPDSPAEIAPEEGGR